MPPHRQRTRVRCPRLTLDRKPIARLLAAIIGAFIAINLVGHVIEHLVGVRDPVFIGIFRRFDFGEEYNLPTWFSATLLLFAAIIIALIFLLERQRHQPYTAHWGVLSVIFFFLSLDESITIHEWTILALRPIISEDNPFFGYSWALIGAPLLALFVLAYLRFFLHLSRPIQRLFFAAGFLYASGAVGLELVAWQADAIFGFESFVWELSVVAKEACEMVGIAVFIYALLSYVQAQGKAVRVAVR